MTAFPAKTLILTTALVLGSLMSNSAHAAILRSSNGVPVLTREGNCVITNWEGSDECEAAKRAAGLETEDTTPVVDHEGAVYFDFNKAVLTKSAKHELDRLALKLKPHDVADNSKKKHHLHHHVYEMPTLTIVGYADRIGKAEYNQKLGMRRAEAVRTYLISKGVKAKKVELRSLGKTAPKADCSADLPRAKLINCLREDRRVDIEVTH